MPELPEVDPIEFLPHAGGFQPRAHEGRIYRARTIFKETKKNA